MRTTLQRRYVPRTLNAVHHPPITAVKRVAVMHWGYGLAVTRAAPA
jgi:hypothetical protein